MSVMWWERHSGKLMLQETCYFDWQNLIAEASRRGFFGQEELQWDSYKILSEQLEQEWLESIEVRRQTTGVKGDKNVPKSLSQDVWLNDEDEDVEFDSRSGN